MWSVALAPAPGGPRMPGILSIVRMYLSMANAHYSSDQQPEKLAPETPLNFRDAAQQNCKGPDAGPDAKPSRQLTQEITRGICGSQVFCLDESTPVAAREVPMALVMVSGGGGLWSPKTPIDWKHPTPQSLALVAAGGILRLGHTRSVHYTKNASPFFFFQCAKETRMAVTTGQPGDIQVTGTAASRSVPNQISFTSAPNWIRLIHVLNRLPPQCPRMQTLK